VLPTIIATQIEAAAMENKAVGREQGEMIRTQQKSVSDNHQICPFHDSLCCTEFGSVLGKVDLSEYVTVTARFR